MSNHPQKSGSLCSGMSGSLCSGIGGSLYPGIGGSLYTGMSGSLYSGIGGSLYPGILTYTDKADFKELEKYGADSISIALTADILNELKIETALNTKKLTSDVLPDEEIQVSKLIFYGTAVLIFLLLTTTIYLIFIKLRSAELNDL